jgi:hypothetical protein
VGKRPESDDDDDEQFPDLPRAIPADTGAFAAAFDDLALGATVAAFDSVLGGHGEPPRWIVAGEGSTHCLRQDASDATGLRFPMAIARDFFGSDVAARARARCAGGHAERAGGIVLRYRDPANYLVARVDAAAGDLRIYRGVNGQRRTLPGGIVAAPIDDQWHTLEFCAEGPKLTATLDGKYTAVAYDSFFMKGRAGVWTKSDSVTEFDDIAFEPINKPGTSK